MTARFALHLNAEGIMLAERLGRGWKLRGQADPADPGFAGQLALLRAAAAGSEAEARAVLVLPDDQIRIETVELDYAPADPSAAIRDLLSERFGIDAAELRLDWQRPGDSFVAALVACQTLTEAEAFARAHGFEPAGSVGRDGLDGFAGSPWFGTVDGSADRPADLPVIGPVERDVPAHGIFSASIATGNAAEPQPLEATVKVLPMEPEATRIAPVAATEEPAEPQPVETTVRALPPEPEVARIEPVAAAEKPVGPQPSETTVRALPPEPEAPRIAPVVATEEPADAQPLDTAAKILPTEPEVARIEHVAAAEEPADAQPLDTTAKALPPEPEAARIAPMAVAPEEILAEPAPVAASTRPATIAARDRARIAASLIPYDPDSDEFPDERAAPRRPVAQKRAVPQPRQRPRPSAGRFGLTLTALLIVAMAGVAFWFGSKSGEDHVILLPEDAAPSEPLVRPAPPVAALPSVEPGAAPVEMVESAPGTEAPAASLPPLADAFGPAPGASMPATSGTLPEFAEARDVFVPSPALVDRADRTPVDIVEQPGLDPETGTDALALAPDIQTADEAAPAALPSPPPPERRFELGEDGLVRPTKDGVPTPDGVLVFAGHPPVTPAQRALPDPAAFAAPIEGAADDPLRKLRPGTRPDGLIDNHERAELGGHTLAELARLRPNRRPGAVEEAAAKLNTASALAVAAVARPDARPEDLAIRVPDVSSAATAAVAAALATPAPPQPQPQAAAPSVPVPQATAAKPAAPPPVAPQPAAPKTPAPQANTRTAAVAPASNAPARGSDFSMSKVSLLGTFGHSSKPRALVRMPNGRVINLEVGDKIDGGRVAAIRAGELYYSKGGQNHVLLMPKS